MASVRPPNLFRKERSTTKPDSCEAFQISDLGFISNSLYLGRVIAEIELFYLSIILLSFLFLFCPKNQLLLLSFLLEDFF